MKNPFAPPYAFFERLARETIYDKIDQELEAQLTKHGDKALIYATLAKQFSITAEEGLEAIESLSQHLLALARGINDDTELVTELVQLAACAVGMATALELKRLDPHANA